MIRTCQTSDRPKILSDMGRSSIVTPVVGAPAAGAIAVGLFGVAAYVLVEVLGKAEPFWAAFRAYC